MPTNIVDKIRKLLQLAEGTSSNGEAEAAMLQAQKLMAQHHLEMRDIEVSTSAIVEFGADEMLRPSTERARLANVIAKNFRCDTLWVRRWGVVRGKPTPKYTLSFVGFPVDVEIADAVYKTALVTMKSQYATWRKLNPGRGRNGSRAFQNGFIAGLRDEYDRQRAGMSDARALVLVTPAKVTEYMLNLNLADRRSNSKPAYDPQARSAGAAAGKAFGTGRAVEGAAKGQLSS